MGKTTTIKEPVGESQELVLTREVQSIVTQAKGFIVQSREDCELAVDVRKRIKDKRKFVKELLGGQVDAAFQAHKQAKAKFNQYDDPLSEADGIFQSKVNVWVREQQRIEAAENERRRLEAERIAIQAEQDRIAAMAQNLIDAGRVEEAEEAASAPIYTEPVKVRKIESSVPKVDMRTLRETYCGVVTDMRKLVEAVASGTVPIMALEPNEKYLNAQAKFAKNTDALNFPGVEVVLE